MKSLRTLAAGLLAGLGLACGTAAQAAWPDHPITLVVPFPPGGTTDMVARPLAQELSKQLGQPVIVDNRAGAGGTIGAAYVARAKPDGYTIFLATIAHTIAPSIYDTLPYDFIKDFAPITIVASCPNILIVNPKLPVDSVASLIDYAKAHPGQVNYGSAGIGSTEHLAGELFGRMAGIKIEHVPYKGGAPMMADLMAGQIQMALETSGSALTQVRANTVKALGVSSAQPSQYLPGVPAIGQAGVPGYSFQTWYGLMAPAGTPADVQAKLYEVTVAALKTPEMKQGMQAIGADPGGEPSKEFGAYIVEQTKKWHDILKGNK
jgi:tripartite-type tricarboxylate transporter receptor subunit TctC